ncbi:MAG TPA: AAA family ATPase [Marmoricola sp.]|nr:AAA family ATPase [Marmoricola sp.]
MADGTHLLEREAELEALRAVVDASAGGSGAAALVLGEAGIGKSSLLASMSTFAADSGLEVLRARGIPVESEYAFGGLRQLLTAALRRLDADALRTLGESPAAVIQQTLGISVGDAPEDQFAVHHALFWTLDLLARRKAIVLVVDDAQWLDAPTLSALVFVARRVADLPVALAFGWRTGEPGPADLFAELDDLPDVVRVAPRPLTRAATGSLLEEAQPDASSELLDACLTATGGNPFLLGELLDALPEDVDPASVAGLSPTEVIRGVTGQLRRLAPGVTDVARAVAVLDGDADLGVVAAVAGVGVNDALEAVDTLIEARLLTGDARKPTFRHPLLRAAVYRAMSLGERSVAHRAAAGSLAGDPRTSDRGAAHLLEVVPSEDPWVVEQLVAAARRAVSSGAPTTAIRLVRRALAEQPSVTAPELWWELGHAQLLAGDNDAVQSLRKALDGAPTAGVRVRAATDLCQVLSATDRLDDAMETLRAESGRLDESDPGLAYQLRSLAVIGLDDAQTAPRTIETVRALVAPGVSDDLFGRRLLLTDAYARALVSDGPCAEVVRLAAPALQPGWWREHPGSAMTPLYAGLATLVWTGQLERATTDATEVVRDAEQAGDLIRLGGACYWSSTTAYLRGDLAEAEDLARRALEHSRPSPFLHRMSVAAVLRALVARGKESECDVVLADEGLTGPLPNSIGGACLAYARSEAHVANGRAEEALQDTMLLGAFTSARGGSVPGWGRPSQEVLRRTGRLDLAVQVAEQALEQARSWGEPGTLGVALCNAGRLGSDDAGLDRLAEGVALLEASPLLLERALGLAAYGAALRRTGKTSRARTALEQAVDLAHRCGAARVRDEALEELRMTGARPRRLAVTGVEALTAAEYRVARRAADGLTNTELCQALFLSRSTVEKHLTSAYRKLGVSSRDQLRDALTATGEPTDDLTSRS